MRENKELVHSLQTTLGRMEIALGTIHEAIVWVNTHNIIQWCNKSFDKIIGIPHIAVLGATLHEILPLKKNGQPVPLSQYPCQLLRGESTINNEVYLFLNNERETHLEISGNYTTFEESKITVLTIRDITALLKSQLELKKAKETLEESVKRRTDELQLVSNKYKSIVAEAVDAIITISQRAEVLSFNPAAEQMFGYHEDEVIGKNVSLLMPSPIREEHDQIIKNYLTTGIKKIIGVGGREVTGVRRNGQQFPLELAVSEVQLKDQVIFTGILRDMTTRKQEQETLKNAMLEAEEASMAKSDFLTHMSHEIRTPLTAILGMADLLEDSKPNKEQEKYISIFKRAGDHLLSIINDLMDLAKIEADQFTLDTIPFNLKELISDTHAIMETEARIKHLNLHYSLESGIPSTIFGDPTRLRQVLINLIGNAIKFTNKGSVSLHVRLVQPAVTHNSKPKRIEIEFTVKDTGIGISKEKRELIFDRFSQADHSITRKFGGTGLGLAVSRSLAVLMGGNIIVSSVEEAGSTFTLKAHFGINDGDEGQHEDEKLKIISPRVPQSFPGPLKILLAEDSADNRFLFKAYLKDSDCTIEFAEDGQIAVQKFLETDFDLILMDIQMPVLDGYSATRLIRSHERQKNVPTVPIIALTAHALLEEKEKSIQAGCNMHVVKPVSKQNFLAAIQRVIAENDFSPSPKNAASPPLITVNIDRMLEDLIPGFLENRRHDIIKIREAVRQGDLETIKHLGHTMKGTGGGYGFENITEIGKNIENAAHQKSSEIILQLVEELEKYINTVHIVFVD